jgi:putative heme-binding domain-containing protein
MARRGTAYPWIMICLLGWLLVPAAAWSAEEAEWIWTPEHEKTAVPQTACYFRKTIEGPESEAGKIVITADDAYELYLNGRLIGRGQANRSDTAGLMLDEYDISKSLSRNGSNTLAVRVVNERGGTAALVARVLIKELNGPWRSYSTDVSWRTNLRPLPLWNSTVYNDGRWAAAQSFGRLGETAPWDRPKDRPAEEQEKSEQLQISEEFDVQQIVDGEAVGSVIAMTFNEFGHLVLSREGGPLLLVHHGRMPGSWSEVRTYCEKVTNCQGILALNGDIYVTGDGPEGQALYRLSDRDRDGTLENVKTLIKFDGAMGEHGAHGLSLGPDGWLYVIVGNHTLPSDGVDDTSPHRGYYEGDLVGPRYEDPSGHANGVQAPGGMVLRTDLEGKQVELVCGGIRNAYDVLFNRDGELFVHDSDMESDVGAPWYRPTHLYQILAGGEYGWRSGWAKWPTYYYDSLPPTLETGRGSPAGGVVYDHFMFPRRYHNSLFLADWSQGRILAVQLQPDGAGYSAESEVFLQGSPLNVTDLDVGPDGALYFVTGGRGTSGGVYRVSWKGTVPRAVQDLGQGISRAIRHPQIQSAWARQNIALTKEELDQQWGRLLNGVVASTANPPEYRLRALDLMQLFGPPPTREVLMQLSQDEREALRAKIAELMGLHASKESETALVKMLNDRSGLVRRKACEALARAQQTAPIENLLPLLKSEDRFESWAARRLLERLPVEQWQTQVLTSDDSRIFIQGGLALMIAHPDPETAKQVVSRLEHFFAGFVSDRDFIDMLRLAQVALHRSPPPAEDLAALRKTLAAEYPAGNPLMNRELVRLLIYLQAVEPMDRYFAFLASDAPDIEKLHLALNLRFLNNGWTNERRQELLTFLEGAQQWEGGGSYAFYIRNVERDFAKTFDEPLRRDVLAQGDRWPSAALGALYGLPAQLDDEMRNQLIELDSRLGTQAGDNGKALRVGILAVLARDGSEPAMAYLREVWDREPERRTTVAMGLAQAPDGENWSYLVRSLPILDGPAVHGVIQKLLAVPKAPAEAEYVRQVILAGLKLQDQGGDDALALLEYWTGEQPASADDPITKQLSAWQRWFAERHPELPAATLPKSVETSKWKVDELLKYLASEDAAKATSERGSQVFVKAQCSKCHRFGQTGEPLGPDLTTLTSRFMRKEVLESILFPSHVISDQYSAKIVRTIDGKVYTGMVTTVGQTLTILQASGEKIELAADQIEETSISNVSSMPEGLLENLTQEEVADLFAYLGYRPPARVVRRNSGTVQAAPQSTVPR